MDKIKNTLKNKKILIIACVFTVVLVLVALAVFRPGSKQLNTPNTAANKAADTAISPTEKTNKTPIPGPTEQEKQDAEKHKDDLVKEQAATTPPPATGKAVTMVVSSFSQKEPGAGVFLSSFASGVVEDGGTCTYKLVNGSAAINRSVAAFANATTTNCSNVTVPTSDFSIKGEWTLTVSYVSPSAQGSSGAKTLNVQ